MTHRPDGTIRSSDTVLPATVDWSLLSAQGHVLFYIALCPDSTVQDIASAIGHTERQIRSMIQTLRSSGMLRLRKKGRRHYYSIDLDAPLLHPTIEGLTLRPIIGPMVKQARAMAPDICQDSEIMGARAVK